MFTRLQASDDWKYSTREKRDLVQFSPVKAHYALSYTRFRSDDPVIGVYESLYVLSLAEGSLGHSCAFDVLGPDIEQVSSEVILVRLVGDVSRS